MIAIAKQNTESMYIYIFLSNIKNKPHKIIKYNFIYSLSTILKTKYIKGVILTPEQIFVQKFPASEKTVQKDYEVVVIR